MRDNQVNSDYMHVLKGGPQKVHHEESTSCFRTAKLPETLDGAAADIELARHIIDGWRQDGIVRLKITSKQIEIFRQADTSCRRFFNHSLTGEDQMCSTSGPIQAIPPAGRKLPTMSNICPRSSQ
jgi:hypothetical protein